MITQVLSSQRGASAPVAAVQFGLTAIICDHVMRSKSAGAERKTMSGSRACMLKRLLPVAASLTLVTLLARPGMAADDLSVRFSYKLKGEYGFFFMGQAKGAYSNAGLA